MNMSYGKVKGKFGAGISLLLSKRIKGTPLYGRITVINTYAFTSYALQRNLGFIPGIFGTETND